MRTSSKLDANQQFSLMSRTLTRVAGLETEDDDSSCESENQMMRTWRPTSEDSDDSDDSDDGEKEEEYERLSSGRCPFTVRLISTGRRRKPQKDLYVIVEENWKSNPRERPNLECNISKGLHPRYSLC
jgi:hypothetical protein